MNRKSKNMYVRCIHTDPKDIDGNRLDITHGRIYEVFESSLTDRIWVIVTNDDDWLAIFDPDKPEAADNFFERHFEVVPSANEAYDRAMSIL